MKKIMASKVTQATYDDPCDVSKIIASVRSQADMDKTEVLSRLTFCGECAFWHPLNAKMLKEEYRGYIGCCNRPREAMVERCKDDFCSRGCPKRKD